MLEGIGVIMNIDVFFDYVNKLFFKNKIIDPNFVMTPDIFYSILVRYEKSNNSIEPFFNIWVQRFKSRPGISVFKRKYFCYFTNGKLNYDNAIKLYISLDEKRLDSNVTRIFDFIRSNNIIHISKVCMFIRNDNVIIRVDSLDSVRKIIDFISNSDIKNDIKGINPLIPSYNGIGIVRDGVYSCDYELSNVCSSIINKNKKISSKLFFDYLGQKNISFDLKIIYDFILNGIECHDLNDILVINFKREFSSKVLYDIMKATYDKYGIKQVEYGLFEYIVNGNANYFTRGAGDLRIRFIQHMNSKDALKIVENTVLKSNDLKQMIKKFVNYVFIDSISLEKENENKDVDDYLSFLNDFYLKYGYDKLKEYILFSYQGKIKYNGDVNLICFNILKSIYYDDKKVNELINDKSFVFIIANIVSSKV